jgi:hypothetical protein
MARVSTEYSPNRQKERKYLISSTCTMALLEPPTGMICLKFQSSTKVERRYCIKFRSIFECGHYFHSSPPPARYVFAGDVRGLTQRRRRRLFLSARLPRAQRLRYGTLCNPQRIRFGVHPMLSALRNLTFVVCGRTFTYFQYRPRWFKTGNNYARRPLAFIFAFIYVK